MNPDTDPEALTRAMMEAGEAAQRFALDSACALKSASTGLRRGSRDFNQCKSLFDDG